MNIARINLKGSYNVKKGYGGTFIGSISKQPCARKLAKYRIVFGRFRNQFKYRNISWIGLEGTMIVIRCRASKTFFRCISLAESAVNIAWTDSPFLVCEIFSNWQKLGVMNGSYWIEL